MRQIKPNCEAKKRYHSLSDNEKKMKTRETNQYSEDYSEVFNTSERCMSLVRGYKKEHPSSYLPAATLASCHL